MSGFLSQLGSRLNPGAGRGRPLGTLPGQRNDDYVFLYKVRHGITFVGDSIPRSIDNIEKVMGAVDRQIVEDGRDEKDEVIYVFIQLVTNLILDLNNNRKNVIQIDDDKRNLLKTGLNLYSKPSTLKVDNILNYSGERYSAEEMKGAIDRSNIITEASIRTAEDVFAPDFHNGSNPFGNRAPRNLTINPNDVVELFGSAISTTKFELNRYNRPGQAIYNAYGENNISAPLKVQNPVLRSRTIELNPEQNTMELLSGEMVLYSSTGGLGRKLIKKGGKNVFVYRDSVRPVNQNFYFASEEEYKAYDRSGGVFARVSTDELVVLNKKIELNYTNMDLTIDNNRGFKRQFYAHKLWDAFAESSYNYDQEYNSNTYRVFESWLSTQALEIVFYRFAYFCLLLGDQDRSKVDAGKDELELNVKQREAKYYENFKTMINKDFEEIKEEVMGMYSNVKPLFRIQGQIKQILGHDFVGTGRKRPTAVFKELKLSRSLTLTVMDPPQIANNCCFRSAINFINPRLVGHIDRNYENNLDYIKWFCETYQIGLADENTQSFYSQNFVVSEALTDLYHNQKDVFPTLTFHEMKLAEPALTPYWTIQSLKNKYVVVYALEERIPQLFVHDNHVYIVAKAIEREKQCHKCHMTKDLVYSNKHFLCVNCLKKSLKKKPLGVALKLSTWDSESFPWLQFDSKIKHEIHSITHSVCNYFSSGGKFDNKLIDEFCAERKSKKQNIKKMLKTIQNQRRYDLFLSRDVKKIIDDLNKKNEKGEYLISDDEALEILCKELQITNYEYTNTKDFLAKLKELHEKEDHYALYAHNSAKFDSLLILWEAMKSEGFDYHKFLPVGNSVLEFDFFGHRFLDSYKLVQGSLDSLCKDYKLGRFSKILEIEGVDDQGIPKIWKVKELFNLRPYYTSEEEYVNLLKKYQVWDGFQKYGVLDTISLLLIMIFFIEAAMKITVQTLEISEWYKDAPEFQLEEFEDVLITNKQKMKYQILSKIFDNPCMTLGQLATKISESCSTPSYEKLIEFYGYKIVSEKVLRYNQGPRKGQLIPNSINILNQLAYYVQQKAKPLEPDEGEEGKCLSSHQTIELLNKQGGSSNVNPEFIGKVIEDANMDYNDISSQYPAVCLGPIYHHENHPGGFGSKLEEIMGGRSYYPNYQGKDSVTETKGQAVIDLLNGAVYPTSTTEYYKEGNYYLARTVNLTSANPFTCCLDFIIKTNKHMYNVIGSRAGSNIDWYAPNLMTKRYRKQLSDEQFQAFEATYGPFVLEDYLVADEVKVFELIRYKFIFQISADDYAVIYHLKSEKTIFYNLMSICALGKEDQDILKENNDPAYNPSLRTAYKGFMNIETGKKNQNPKKTSKKLLADDASFEEENKYNKIEIINGKIAVYEDKVSSTYAYIGSRIYSKSKQLLFWYLEKTGWETVAKVETDGWANVDAKGIIGKEYIGPQMGQITTAKVKKMVILGRKCSSILEEGQKFPCITFRGLCKADALGYKLDTVDPNMKNENEENFSYYQWDRIFNDVLKDKTLTINQKLSKRTLFSNMTNIEVIHTPKVFKFDF